jgi:hypothetical protein
MYASLIQEKIEVAIAEIQQHLHLIKGEMKTVAKSVQVDL